MTGTKTQQGDVDEILSKYFQGQLPAPWPEWRTPVSRSVPMRKPSWLSLRRWAVAASVVALLTAYLALAGFFPRERSGRLDADPYRNIGQKMQPKIDSRTP